MKKGKFILFVGLLVICFAFSPAAFAKVGGGSHGATCSSDCGSCSGDSCSVGTNGTVTCTRETTEGNATTTVTVRIVCSPDGSGSSTNMVDPAGTTVHNGFLSGTYNPIERF